MCALIGVNPKNKHMGPIKSPLNVSMSESKLRHEASSELSYQGYSCCYHCKTSWCTLDNSVYCLNFTGLNLYELWVIREMISTKFFVVHRCWERWSGEASRRVQGISHNSQCYATTYEWQLNSTCTSVFEFCTYTPILLVWCLDCRFAKSFQQNILKEWFVKMSLPLIFMQTITLSPETWCYRWGSFVSTACIDLTRSTWRVGRCTPSSNAVFWIFNACNK